MENTFRRPWLAAILAIVLSACSGGSSPTSPTTTPSNSGTPSLSVDSVTASATLTSTGVTYQFALVIRETGGRAGATVSSITWVLANSARSIRVTADSTSPNVTGIPGSLAAGGSLSYHFTTTVVATDVFDNISFVIGYTNQGVAGTFTSSSFSIAAPSGTPSPSPTPTPLPPPSGGNPFDATYDFTFTYAVAGGATQTQRIPAFLEIASGRITSADGSVSGTISANGTATFTSVCPDNEFVNATWLGPFSGSGSSRGGGGNYSCPADPAHGIVAYKGTWSAGNPR